MCITRLFRIPSLFCLGLVLALCASIASAQNVAASIAAIRPPTRGQPAIQAHDSAGTQTTQPPARRVEERRFLKDILKDQKEIWTSPFHMSRSDAMWTVPTLLGAAALVGNDGEINEAVPKTGSSVRISNDISYIGAGYTLAGIAGAEYLFGRATHNERARETGLLGIEALIDETIVVQALKLATNRERPNKTNGRSDFYDGGDGFPSGHAAASWTLATVFAEQYSDHRFVPWVAYGLASAVSIARVTSVKHSTSDVFVGGVIGYLIGHHVVKRGAHSAERASIEVLPFAQPATHSYGITGTISF